MLSREYKIENCLVIWDFIFAGAYTQLAQGGDLMQNLDFLCVAMILSKKSELLESDFSMCLGTLMSFKEPDSIIEILIRAQKVRSAIVDG